MGGCASSDRIGLIEEQYRSVAMDDPKQPEQSRHWILRSKLEMPRKNARLIVRANLLERLDRWLELRLGVVVAPAGYAKSTTIAELCRSQTEHGTVIA